MSDVNPYQTPHSDVSVADNSTNQLASRLARFGASFVDGLVMLVVILPMMYLMGVFNSIASGKEPSMGIMFLIAVVGYVVFAAINYAPLKKNGQTVGKKVANIRIADMQGNKPDVGTILLKRYLPVQFVGQVPVIGGLASLIDILFIFRKDRRCVHDLIAGTQVISAK